MQNNTFSSSFVGQNLIELERVDSTNNFLKNELSNSKPLPEGTVILAEDQFAGRGQFSNKWLSDAGKNLTFSVLLNPSFLGISSQFKYNIAISLAINDVLSRFIASESFKIKWPNDIYFGRDKLGGILIENVLTGSTYKHAITGIGLNINQTNYPVDIQRVTSLRLITGREHQLPVLLEALCQAIEDRYLELKAGKSAQQYKQYLSKLYLYNTPARYEFNGHTHTGIIKGVSPQGLLQVEAEGKKYEFNFKEISYLHQ